MNKTDLIDYADYLLKTAMYKVDNIVDAEDLVQDTLMEALLALEKGKLVDNAKGWLLTALNRKYYDRLRQKYKMPTVSMDAIVDMGQDDLSYEKLEQSDDAEEIRRCLANLTRLYRDIMVRYYMHGESIKQIAGSLNIPGNTVKTRLDTGRKHIRKEIDMQSYTKQSYEPELLWLGCSGQCGINNEPFSLINSDRIAMNLLILAYEKPITLPELAKAIGISTTYIEPIVDRLVDGELMKRVSDRVYTDFIIYTEKDRTKNLKQEEELADTLYKSIWSELEYRLDELRAEDFYKEQEVTGQIKMESYFAVKTLQKAVHDVRDEACGGIQPYEEYPDRPNGGKWYAMGSAYPANYNRSDNSYQRYYISGEAACGLDYYCGLKKVLLSDFDCELGRTHTMYGKLKYPMSTVDVMKMLYAIYSGREEDLPIINVHCFDNISEFEKLNFLRNVNGKTVIDLPVITMKDRRRIFDISDRCSTVISGRFHDDFMELMKNKLEVPKHLKSVPEWQKYMNCCSTFTMRVILKAKKSGLFLNGYNREDYPVPAIVLVIEK